MELVNTVKRDVQKSKVHKFEAEKLMPALPKERFRIGKCQEWVDRILQEHGYKTVAVLPGRKGLLQLRVEAEGITLPTPHRNIVSICRAVAHVIAEKLYPDEPANGKGFVGIYFELLERYAGLEAPALRAEARTFGIRVTTKTALVGKRVVMKKRTRLSKRKPELYERTKFVDLG